VNERIIDDWLIEHYSGAWPLDEQRARALRNRALHSPGIAPPVVDTVFRGMANVTPAEFARARLQSKSQPRNMSWTLSHAMARSFANAEFSKARPLPGRLAVVWAARAAPDKMLLNSAVIASCRPRVANFWHEVWQEPLGPTIRKEREVIVLAPLTLIGVEAWPMGSPRLVEVPFQNVLFGRRCAK
jgi:hypothetical protein